MKISIFSSLDGFPSLERYAQELSRNFPPGVEANRVWFQKTAGPRGRFFDRYLKYLWVARKQQGDRNIIISEGYSFLLLALPAERTIVVCHDVHPLIYKGPNPPGFWRWRYRRNLRMMGRAKFVVTVSQHTRKDLLKYCPFLLPEKVVAVHSGLDASWRVLGDAARLTAFRRAQGLEGKRFALHVGNDNWYKNFGGLLRALAALPDKDLILVKVGDIGAGNRQLMTSLGLDARVLHVPRATSEELLDFYNAAEMLIFPSWHEGFGWPPLEAMASGCPVIACLFIQPEDAPGIAAAMERLLKDTMLRAELITKGKAQAARFRWRNTAEAMLRLFQE